MSDDSPYHSEWVRTSQVKSSQVKSYTHIYMTETNNKDDHHSIVIIIIMINVVNYIDKIEE